MISVTIAWPDDSGNRAAEAAAVLARVRANGWSAGDAAFLKAALQEPGCEIAASVSQGSTRTTLRLSAGTYARIHNAAAEDGRSVNAQILALVEQGLRIAER